MTELRKWRRKTVAVEVFVAVTTAAAGAAVGSWLGWQTAPALPSNDQAVSIAREAIPAYNLVGDMRRDVLFAYEYPGESTSERVWTTVVGTDDYNSGYVGITATADPDVAMTLSTIAGNLRTAGWHVEMTDLGLRATHGPTVVELEPNSNAGEPLQSSMGVLNPYLVIERAAPAAALPAAILGWLIGAMIGVLMMRLGTRHLARRSPAIQAAVTAMTITGLILLVPATILTTGNLLAYAAYPDVAIWDGYLFWMVRGCANFGALWLLAALTLLVTRRPKAALAAATAMPSHGQLIHNAER
jgi:hypothetical protein